MSQTRPKHYILENKRHSNPPLVAPFFIKEFDGWFRKDLQTGDYIKLHNHVHFFNKIPSQYISEAARLSETMAQMGELLGMSRMCMDRNIGGKTEFLHLKKRAEDEYEKKSLMPVIGMKRSNPASNNSSIEPAAKISPSSQGMFAAVVAQPAVVVDPTPSNKMSLSFVVNEPK